MATPLRERLAGAVIEDVASGAFRCRRDIFTDASLFDLEMKHIFEGNWIYLAHESQIPEPNDYCTTRIGRQPIVITRVKAGRLDALISACAHRGAMLCRRKHGNKNSFTCQAARSPARAAKNTLQVALSWETGWKTARQRK